MKLLLGIFYGILAQILTFAQLQSQFKYEWAKENMVLMSLLGIPVSYLYIISVQNLVSYYDSNLWPSRIVGFGIGVLVYTGMTWLWFREPVTIKTGVCLVLALVVILVQIYWK